MKCEICNYPDGFHSGNCSEWLRSQLDAYKIALKYFIQEGGQPAADIARNLLKEVEK